MTELVVMPEDPVRVTAVLEGQAQLAGRTDLATGKPETSKLAARETWGRGPMRETPFHGVYLSRSHA